MKNKKSLTLEDKVRVFIKSVPISNQINSTALLGIDPGVNGAIAIYVDDEYYEAFNIPHTKIKKGKRYTSVPDYEDISSAFAKFALLSCLDSVILEEIPAGMHPGRVHAQTILNRAWAMWPLFLISKGYTIINAAPKDWKRDLGLLKKDKEASRMRAKSLFPKIRLDRVKDEGRAEALLLIAWYLKKQGLWA